MVYQLDLPPAWWIHPIFHVSNLKGFNWCTEFIRVVRPPSPIVIEGEEEYEVEGILQHRGKGALRWYLVLWKVYPLSRASWELVSHLKHTPLILEEYLHKVAKSGGLQHWVQQKKWHEVGVAAELPWAGWVWLGWATKRRAYLLQGKLCAVCQTCKGQVYMGEPHQPGSCNRTIHWVGDIMTLFCGGLDIYYFLFLLVGFRVWGHPLSYGREWCCAPSVFLLVVSTRGTIFGRISTVGAFNIFNYCGNVRY